MKSATRARGNESPIAVGVYDEPELIVSGVHGLLARSGPRAEVVTIAADSEAAAVDVLLCDPIGRRTQLEDYLSVVAGLTRAPVLVYTWSSSRSGARRSLAAGARGFMSKAASGLDLSAAVTALHRGETLAPPAGLANGHDGAADLSTREAEVLELICAGHSNLEIADQLYVSVNSVKTYVRQIYQKVGVTRRAQAVVWGLAHGF
jgi:DNA-binding NarL/FixJ family response regulator